MQACKPIKQYGPLLGRILISLIFILSGWGKIGHFDQTLGFMASKGVPMTELALIVTIIIELGGGLMILLGWKTRLAAMIMFLWLIPVTLTIHNFWGAPADQMQNQLNHFLKNIAIMGAMVYLMVFGSGPLSFGKDHCASKQEQGA